MSHQNTEVDVESLQQSGRRRGSCLDVFLVTSVLFLFVAVGALAVGGVMAVKELQSPHMPEFHAERMAGGTPSPSFKMQHFAYLEPTSSLLENITLALATVKYGEGETLGSNYEFNKHQYSLKPLQEGVYFIYINLKVNCVSTCNTGVLRLTVANKMTCDVELSANQASVSKKCWTVGHLRAEGMAIGMTVPKEGLEHWRLDLQNSNFGIFLVD